MDLREGTNNQVAGSCNADTLLAMLSAMLTLYIYTQTNSISHYRTASIDYIGY